jgi:hypothetical protein
MTPTHYPFYSLEWDLMAYLWDMGHSARTVYAGPDHLPIAVLESEGSLDAVLAEDRYQRAALAGRFRRLPTEALSLLRHVQPQIGCPNLCSFCSQGAGTTMWHLSRPGLANVISAIKTVALETAVRDGRVCAEPLTQSGVFADNFTMPQLGLIGHARGDKPGVIYPYLDNDPAIYPYLDDYIAWMANDLGVKTRISSVGFSRRNDSFLKMHARIATDLAPYIAGLRLSMTSYTGGWSKGAGPKGVARRREFADDTAAFLRLYRDSFLRRGKLGSNQRGDSSIELRFKPLVVKSAVYVGQLAGHNVIRSGPHLVVATAAGAFSPVATLRDPKHRDLLLTEPGQHCMRILGQPAYLQEHWQTIAQAVIAGDALPDDLVYRPAMLHTLENEDGIYYAADAERQKHGVYSAYFYPLLGRRPGAGYIDGTRPFLNALLKHKSAGQDQSWSDVASLIIEACAESLEKYDSKAAGYVMLEVLPLVRSCANALRLADYPPAAFFDKSVTLDTGHICNLGDAYKDYHAIASRPNLPMTPNHERSFGQNGDLAAEGTTWRVSVGALVSPEHGSSHRSGTRNAPVDTPSLIVECLRLTDTATPAGQTQERFRLPIDSVDSMTAKEAAALPITPGYLPKEETV